MVFITLIQTFGFLVLFADFLYRRFPQETTNITTNIIFNSFYMYSKLQLLLIKASNKLFILIENNPNLIQIRDLLKSRKIFVSKNVEIVRDGEIVHRFWTDDLKNMTKYPKEYDFIIYSDYNNNDSNNCINKIILYNQEKIEDQYTKSNISFILTFYSNRLIL